MKPNRRLSATFRAYWQELWPVVSLIAVVGIGITAGFEAFGLPWRVPPWVIWIICTIILIVTNFLTYHQMRLKLLDRIESDRGAIHLPRERRERVHRIKDLAGEMMHHISLEEAEETKRLLGEMLRMSATLHDLKIYGTKSLHDVVELFGITAEHAATPSRRVSDPPYDILTSACDLLLEMYPPGRRWDQGD